MSSIGSCPYVQRELGLAQLCQYDVPEQLLLHNLDILRYVFQLVFTGKTKKEATNNAHRFGEVCVLMHLIEHKELFESEERHAHAELLKVQEDLIPESFNSMIFVDRSLKAIPSQLKTFSVLEHVTFYHNVISSRTLINLPVSLIKLTLSINRITDITMLCALKNLEVLSAQRNQITKIPDDFVESLPNLVYVDLSYNEIEQLPVSLGKLICLKTFNMFRNKIQKEQVPPCLQGLVDRKILGFTGPLYDESFY